MITDKIDKQTKIKRQILISKLNKVLQDDLIPYNFYEVLRNKVENYNLEELDFYINNPEMFIAYPKDTVGDELKFASKFFIGIAVFTLIFVIGGIALGITNIFFICSVYTLIMGALGVFGFIAYNDWVSKLINLVIVCIGEFGYIYAMFPLILKALNKGG